MESGEEDPGNVSSASSTPTDKEEEYVVEKIVNERVYWSTGETEYLVKWEGYSSNVNTWETKKNLRNAPAKLRKWEEEKRSKLANYSERHRKKRELFSRSFGGDEEEEEEEGVCAESGGGGGDNVPPADSLVTVDSYGLLSYTTGGDPPQDLEEGDLEETETEDIQTMLVVPEDTPEEEEEESSQDHLMEGTVQDVIWMPPPPPATVGSLSGSGLVTDFNTQFDLHCNALKDWTRQEVVKQVEQKVREATERLELENSVLKDNNARLVKNMKNVDLFLMHRKDPVLDKLQKENAELKQKVRDFEEGGEEAAETLEKVASLFSIVLRYKVSPAAVRRTLPQVQAKVTESLEKAEKLDEFRVLFEKQGGGGEGGGGGDGVEGQ